MTAIRVFAGVFHPPLVQTITGRENCNSAMHDLEYIKVNGGQIKYAGSVGSLRPWSFHTLPLSKHQRSVKSAGSHKQRSTEVKVNGGQINRDPQHLRPCSQIKQQPPGITCQYIIGTMNSKNDHMQSGKSETSKQNGRRALSPFQFLWCLQTFQMQHKHRHLDLDTRNKEAIA